MTGSYEESSPQEEEDLRRAAKRIDPAGHALAEFSYFLQRLGEVRAMDEDEIPEDPSDAWVFKDPRYIGAVGEHHEAFDFAVKAVAHLFAAERAVNEIRTYIEGNVGRMQIARNQLAAAEIVTTADFELPGDTPPSDQ